MAIVVVSAFLLKLLIVTAVSAQPFIAGNDENSNVLQYDCLNSCGSQALCQCYDAHENQLEDRRIKI